MLLLFNLAYLAAGIGAVAGARVAGALPQLEQPVWQPQLLWQLVWQGVLHTGTQTRTFLQTV